MKVTSAKFDHPYKKVNLVGMIKKERQQVIAVLPRRSIQYLSKDNYRQIHHENEMAKLVEYITYQQTIEHFETQEIFHPSHLEALPGLSPAIAVNEEMDKILRAEDNGNQLAGLLFDQRCAFD